MLGDDATALPLISAVKLRRSDGPLYRQVEARLRGTILSGELAEGALLPTEAALAANFGVSLITVRQALRELQAAGLVQKRAAKPAIVAAPTPRRINTIEDVAAAASGAKLEIASYAPRRDAGAAQALALPPDTLMPCLRGRMLVGTTPMTAITIHFPPDIGQQLRRENFDDVVVFRSVERALGITLSGARVTVSAEVADRALARQLGIAPGAAVLAVHLLYLDRNGRPVERTVAKHRADLYSMQYELRG